MAVTINGSSGLTANDGSVFTNASGNVGIGTGSPTEKLQVAGAIVATGAAGSYSADGVYLQNKGFSQFDIAAHRGGGNASLLTFSTNAASASPIERMRIDSAGRVTMPYQPCVTAAITGANGMTGGGEILWNQVLVNNGSHYNAANGRFTAPVAGFYRISIGGIVNVAGGTAGSATLLPYKNGATIGGQYGRAYYEQASSTGAKYVQMFGQWIVQCAAGDTLSANGNVYRELANAYSSYTIELVG